MRCGHDLQHGEVLVMPGDVMVGDGDGDGVVCIPRAGADTVATDAYEAFRRKTS
jgi:regulator of RNase E activity RraA